MSQSQIIISVIIQDSAVLHCMGKDLQKCFTKNGNNTNDHIIMLQQWKKVRNGHFCCTLLHK